MGSLQSRRERLAAHRNVRQAFRPQFLPLVGASPLFLLGRYFAGVRPTKAGYSEYEAAPELSKLGWFEASVPTPFGEIKISMDKNSVEIKSDGGIGTLRLKSAAEPICEGLKFKSDGGGNYSARIEPKKPTAYGTKNLNPKPYPPDFSANFLRPPFKAFQLKGMKVLGKQRNSRMCFICGMENPVGLKSQFYNMEDGSALTLFTYLPAHQSFPQRVHGGLIATMLDELTLRGYWVLDETMLGVTTSMSVKFRKPVPYGVELVGRGIVARETSRYFVTRTAITDRDGRILAEAESNYIKLPAEKIADGASYHDEMRYLIEDGVTEIDVEKF